MQAGNYYYCFGRYIELSNHEPVIKDIEERFKHLYLVGLSGMGKSTVMENLAQYDIAQGYSVIFIDPKGDSAQKLYYHFRNNPKVRYVSYDSPLIVNLFDKQGYDIFTLMDEFIQIMDNVIIATTSNPESTVRMKEVVYQTILSFAAEDRNFEYIYKFLNSKDARRTYQFTDLEFRKWWDDLFNPQKTDYKKRSEYEVTMSSVASRLHQALTNPRSKVFINGENELDIEKLVKKGESLIINVKSSNDFIKVFITNIIVGAVLSYMSLEKKTKPLFVYIDEFDLVASGQFAQSLQLGRSSLVGFTLAHQNFSSAKSLEHKRMIQAVIDSIFGAVSNYLVFNCSPLVAKTLSDVYNLPISDFSELDKYEARLRLGNKKMFITTKKPILTNIPEDYIFPTITHPTGSSLNFLGNDWIVI